MPRRFSLQPPPFLRQFLHLSAINILSNLMVPLAGLLDMAFLGHLAEIRHLAGVSLAMVVFNYLYWTFGFLRMGTTGLTAQAIGRQDDEAVVLIGLRHASLALVLGVIILALQQPLRWVGFAWLAATPDVKAAGEAFYQALIWSAPATLLNFVLIGWFLGRSRSDLVLLLTVVGSGINVLLDYVFIVRLGWASVGAGASTAISQYGMLMVGLGCASYDRAFANFRRLLPKLWDPVATKAIFSLNSDILIRTLALVSTFAVFTNLGAALGAIVLTTNAILMQGVTIAAYFIDGLAFATETLAGLLWGRGNSVQLRQLVHIASGTSVGFGLLVGGAFVAQPDLFRSLTSHSEVIDSVREYVGWLLPVLGMGSIAYLLDGYFLGLTQGGVLRRSMLQAVLIGFAPMAAVAWWLRSNHGLWLALTLFMAARALTLSLQVPKTLNSSQHPQVDSLHR